MPPEILQLGAVAVIFLFAVKEFFAYLRTKKTNGNGNSSLNQAILSELQMMNENHLHALKDAIEKGNERLVDVIHSDNTRIIEALGEIKGKLSK